jgi:hypothetical protein
MTLELFLQTAVNATYAASYMALIAVGLAAIDIREEWRIQIPEERR